MRCNSLKYSTVKPCAIQNNIMQNDIDSSPWTFLSQFTIYSRTSIKRSPTKRPPSIKRPFFKVPNFMSLNCCIQWPPLLSGRGQVIIYCFQQIIFSSELMTGKRHYEEEPCRGHVHRRSTLTVCPVSRLPGCCRIYVKGKRLFLVAATPRLTTANSSECANRGT